MAAESEAELRFHLEGRIEDLMQREGLDRRAAEGEARRRFGDLSDYRQQVREIDDTTYRRRSRMDALDSIRRDVRLALRALRRTPMFTLVCLITLALGIGANSAIFSVVYSVLLAPLPYANGDRILSLREKYGPGEMAVTFGNYKTWLQGAHSFEALGASWGSAPLTLTGNGDPTPVAASRANADYWRAMYIRPTLGRYFSASEDREGASPVVVLSDALWRNRFGADRGILGRSITLGGVAYQVVGVAAPGYILYPPAEKVWVPLIVPASRYEDHKDHELSVYGLVRKGVPTQTAIHELSNIERSLASQYPNSYFDDISAKPLSDAVVGGENTLLYTLLGAVSLVLLIACANVANLLMARASARRAELAVRGALGASRGRLVQQLLMESLVLGVIGGVLGLMVAWAGVRFLVTSPASIPRLQTTTLNAPVVAFTFGLSIICALLFGLIPALRAARLDLQQTLRDGGRESAASSRDRLRGVLVVGELGLSQLLLVGAGLLIRSALMVQSVPPGFQTDNLLVTNVMPARQYTGDALEAHFQQLDAAIAAVPGVRAVGRTSIAPIYGGGFDCAVQREGSNGHDAGAVGANMRAANTNYFSAIGVPLLRGRGFTAADAANGPPTAVLTRSLAESLFGGADPIGKLVTSCIDGADSDHPKWRQVVGVIGDMHAHGLTDGPTPEYYVPSAQWTGNQQQSFVIRGAVPVTTLLPAIRRAVRGVDDKLALSSVKTMDAAIDDSLALPHFTMLLLILLGGTGLILAIVGVYGVIGYFVSQRTRELGIRMALGADAGSVKWLVVKQGIALGLAGVLFGSIASYLASRFLASMLYGVTAHDAVTFGSVAALLLVVAICASYLPARRATRIDPLDAVRAS
jgi:predicted permease